MIDGFTHMQLVRTAAEEAKRTSRRSRPMLRVRPGVMFVIRSRIAAICFQLGQRVQPPTPAIDLSQTQVRI